MNNMALSKKSFFYALTAILSIIIPAILLSVFTNIYGAYDIGLLLISLLMVSFFIYSLKLGDEYALLTLIMTMGTQPLLSALFSEFSSSLLIRVSISLKDIMAITFFAVLFVRNFSKIKLGIIEYVSIFFLALVTISFLSSSAGLFLKLLSLREVLSLFLYFYIGRFIVQRYMSMMTFYHHLIVFVMFFLIFSFCERFLFSVDTWHWFNALHYLQSKFEVGLINGLPLNWYTFITDTQVERRIVGPILEPTSYSRFLSVVTIFIISTLVTKQDILSWKLASLGVVLPSIIILMIANSRGGLLIFIIFILTSIYYRLSKLMKFAFVFVGAPFVLLIIEKSSKLLSLDSGSATRHFTGLMRGLDNMQPFGHGLGTSGQVAFSYGAESVGVKVTESFVGSLVFQVGYIGAVLYFIFALSILMRLHFSNMHQQWKAAGMSIILGLFVTSFLSNSAVAPTSAGFGMVICGILFSVSYLKNWGKK